MSDGIDSLIERIGAKLYERGLSEREASIDATGKPDAIRYIRTRRAMPSADRLDRIAASLGTTSDWLLGKAAAVERTEADDHSARLRTLRSLPRNLPIFGTALASDLDLLTLEGGPVAIEQTEISLAAPQDFMPRPTSIAGRSDMYVVIVAGHSMEPRYDPGRRLLVDGKRPPMIGDDVIVQLKARTGGDGEEEVSAVLIKRLVRRRAGFIVLEQYNPAVTFEVPVHGVHVVHRVTPWDEVLGF